MTELYFIKSEGVILKLQEGAGDNLSQEDLDAGLNFYVLWSTFEFDKDSLEIDEELEIYLSDSGELDMEKDVSLKKALPYVYEMAFNKKFDKKDVVPLKRTKKSKKEEDE